MSIEYLEECLTCEPDGLLMDEPERAAQCHANNHVIRPISRDWLLKNTCVTCGDGIYSQEDANAHLKDGHEVHQAWRSPEGWEEG